MIKYNPKTWFSHIFALRKSDTVFIIWKELVYIVLFTLGLAYVELNYMGDISIYSQLLQVYSLIGFVLSLLLVFRTNTAYDRWWDGRKKWGELVNNSRNLAVKVSVICPDEESKAFFTRMIPNYAFAMKEHLRKGVILDELNLTSEERRELHHANHVPNIILKWIYKRLQELKRENHITDEEFLLIDINLKSFADIIGACERIRNTPIPYSYSIFLKKFIFIFVTTIPLALVVDFGYWSALIVAFIFYVLVSMEILAEEIEDPFGFDDNDLPTDDLCAKIRNNVEEIFA
ncbi:MAG: bestrophin family ion channel [Crocinitomix sp.]|nr:bestrophin family ion channel [Crocinitomix sp.]